MSDFDGAKELRMKLMQAENVNEIKTTINEFLKRKSAGA